MDSVHGRRGCVCVGICNSIGIDVKLSLEFAFGLGFKLAIGVCVKLAVNFAIGFGIEFSVRNVGYKHELPRSVCYPAVLTTKTWRRPNGFCKCNNYLPDAQ